MTDLPNEMLQKNACKAMSSADRLHDAFANADKWESVSVERPKIVAAYLRDLIAEDEEVGKLPLEELVAFLEEEHGL